MLSNLKREIKQFGKNKVNVPIMSKQDVIAYEFLYKQELENPTFTKMQKVTVNGERGKRTYREEF